MSIGILYDERYLDHRDMQWEHPECPERLVAVLAALRRSGLHEKTLARRSREASREEILAVHEAPYYDLLAARMPGNCGRLDPDTFFSEGSWVAATHAAGGAVDLALDVYRGVEGLTGGFALVRPPGHHAEADRGMGFCVFNNVAIVAEALRAAGAERVAILDWDVHHGNGTQHSFASRRDVLYLSSHRYPFYPGTGAARELGEGDGKGFTVNVPLPGGSGDAELMEVFDRVFVPVLMQYKPDVLLVSAGYDAHEADPLGGMEVSDEGFRMMARKLHLVAKATSKGRLVALLEGGYDTEALGRCAVGLLEELTAEEPEEPSKPGGGCNPRVAAVIDEVRRHQEAYWSL
ncbi:MAG: histone deacetylase [Polyangia bacterium]|jgi:acetoin utilization deacetylase AcuC-like enzyme|nr:histone deacetylase [Polyangia bacterium]